MYHRAPLFGLREISPIVRLFTVSDFFLVGGLGLVTPIFALFITDFIDGATVETVGMATAIYLVTRSVGQLPIGILIDRWRGQKDDMLILILSSFGFILISLSYMWISTPLELYIVQFFFGIFSAASYPTWYAIFTRSVDKGKEGFEWSAYQTVADMGAALTAAAGSFVVALYGFNAVFLLMAICSTIGSALLIWSYFIMFGKEEDDFVMDATISRMKNLKEQFVLHIVREAAKKMAGTTLRIMDVGCGTAAYVPQLTELGVPFTYVGVEPITASFEKAEKNLAGTPNTKVYFQLGYDDIAEEKNSFDLVFSMSVLEHIKHLDQFISFCASYLSEGGIMVHRYDLGHALYPHSLKERLHVWLGNTMPFILPERQFVRYLSHSEVEGEFKKCGVTPTMCTFHQMPGS